MSKQQQQEHKDKFLEITISGSYKNGKKDIIDFEDLKGKIPYCDENDGWASAHTRNRYAHNWIKNAKNSKGEKLYPDRILKVRQVYIDEIEVTKGTLSFVGKDLKKLNKDELQELAVNKCINEIPLPTMEMSIRDMRVRAYIAYVKKIHKKELKLNEVETSWMNMPEIILDAKSRIEKGKKLTNDEVIQVEMDNASTASPEVFLTLKDLKELAVEKNLDYDEQMDETALHSFLYGKLFRQI